MHIITQIMNKQIKRYTLLLCLSSILSCFCMTGYAKDFIVVLDAGHGGHDAGAVGRISKEKNINLKVALAVGQLLSQKHNDIKVVYTRKSDKFIPLHERADIANNAKADIFVSIHTNSLPKGKIARGTETYTLGLHRSKENLAVAQKENAVILIESDYKQRYAGFNPNSAESYIMFEFIQDKNMQQSINLAQFVQNQFRITAQRNDRGVRQAGFLVLHATSMPSILVELGYISTPDEEKYLNSSKGIQDLSKSIYQAILNYKQKSRHGNTTVITEDASDAPTEISEESRKEESRQTEKPAAKQTSVKQRKEISDLVDTNTDTDKPVFKIQILTASSPLKATDRRLKGLKPVEYYKENGIYKYTYGASTDYNKIYRMRKEILHKFKDAFIIAFKGDSKMNVQEAIQEFKRNRKK